MSIYNLRSKTKGRKTVQTRQPVAALSVNLGCKRKLDIPPVPTPKRRKTSEPPIPIEKMNSAKLFALVEPTSDFDMLPKEILIAIVHNLSLRQMVGFMFSCRRFYWLVWNHVHNVVLQKDEEVTQIDKMLTRISSVNVHSLKVLVTWTIPTVLGPVTDNTLRLCSQFTNLSILILGKTRIASFTDVGFRYLSKLQNLVHLELDYCRISAAAFDVFTSLDHINNLRIRGFDATEPILDKIAHLPLRRLGLWCGRNRIKDSEFKYLSGLTDLQELILANCTRDDPDSFSHIRSLKQLAHLGVFHDDISDKSFNEITQNTSIKSMHLGGCWTLTDEALKNIIKIEHLTHLAITRAPLITAVGLGVICMLFLQCIHISNCVKITDADLALINSMPTLTRLDLETSGSITNDGMQIISQHPSLKEIRLVAMPNIGDEGLMHLVELATLSALFIKNCIAITRQGVSNLTKSHPNSWINDLVIRFKACVPPIDGELPVIVANDVPPEDWYE